MTFLSPLYLIGAAAAAIPIVLHFLHRQPEVRVKFAAVRLLRQAPVEDTRKRRIREWLLLALRVAALVLIAAAFARPFFPSAHASQAVGATIVALDTSLSMSAPAQFEKAKQLAKDAIRRAPAGDLVGLLTFADTAQATSPPSADRAVALAAIDGAAAGFGGTRYRAALSAAGQMALAAGAANPTIVVVTDLQASGWDAGERVGVPEGARVETVDVGAPAANLAITNAEARGNQIVASVRNAGPARDVRVSLTIDGKHAADAVQPIDAGETRDVAIASSKGTEAVVSVDDPAGIQGDNARYVVLDNASQPAVLVVTTNGDLRRDAFYVQQALSASAASAGFRVEGVAGSALGTMDAQQLGAAEAVLLMSTRGVDAKSRALLSEYLEKGGGLFVAASADVDGDVLSDLVGGAMSESAVAAPAGRTERHLAPIDPRHPVLQPFSADVATLGLATFRQIATLAAKACDTIASFTTGEPAMLDCPVGDGRALVFASDLDNHDNDLPLKATFVPLLLESIRYVGAGHRRGTSFVIGETPPGVAPRPGFAALTTGRVARRVAVNVNPAELDTQRVSPDDFQAAVARLRDAGKADAQLKSSDAEGRQRIWQYLLAAAIAVLVAESVVSMRTA